jgi:hypothetical protein
MGTRKRAGKFGDRRRAVPYKLSEIDFIAAYVIPKTPGSSSPSRTSWA